jgi:hypothetical protein
MELVLYISYHVGDRAWDGFVARLQFAMADGLRALYWAQHGKSLKEESWKEFRSKMDSAKEKPEKTE